MAHDFWVRVNPVYVNKYLPFMAGFSCFIGTYDEHWEEHGEQAPTENER